MDHETTANENKFPLRSRIPINWTTFTELFFFVRYLLFHFYAGKLGCWVAGWMNVCRSVFVSVCLKVYICTYCKSVGLCLCQFVCRRKFWSSCQYVCPSIGMYSCLSVNRYVFMCVCFQVFKLLIDAFVWVLNIILSVKLPKTNFSKKRFLYNLSKLIHPRFHWSIFECTFWSFLRRKLHAFLVNCNYWDSSSIRKNLQISWIPVCGAIMH